MPLKEGFLEDCYTTVVKAEFLDVLDQKFSSLLFTVTSTALTDFTHPTPPPLSTSGLKLVSNKNFVYENLKTESSQDYARKPQQNCTFMNSPSGQGPTVL